MNRRGFLIWQAALGFMAARTSKAQTTSPTVELTRYNISPAGGLLAVNLRNLPSTINWCVGVVAKASDPFVAVLNVGLGPNAMGRPAVKTLADWPSSAVAVSNSDIAVDAGASGGTGLVLYATVPLGTQIQVRSGEKIIEDITPASSFAIYNGRSLEGKVSGLSSLLACFMKPNPPTPDVELKQLRDGSFVATRSGLLAHVTKSELPDLKARALASGRRSRSLIEIEIDETGVVRNYKSLLAGAGLEDLPGWVANWRFNPFLLSGTAVTVRGLIGIMVDTKGTAKW